MKLNDQKNNSQIMQAYNTNMTASYKYLSRDSSAKKTDKSILKSPTHQLSNRASKKGSVQFRSTPIDLHVPPMKSLNREDKEKLIATLLQQVKTQNMVLAQMEERIQQQAQQLDEMNLYNEKFEQKEICYGEIIQNQNKINQRISQLAELKQEAHLLEDPLQAITRIYEDEVDMDMAIKWREARLKFNFIDTLQRAAKYHKVIKVQDAKKEGRTLIRCFKAWKLQVQKKAMLQQFQEVRQLRNLIQSWMTFKEWVVENKELKIKLKQATQYRNHILMKKTFITLHQNYLKENFHLQDQQRITQTAIEELTKIKLYRIMSLWVLHVKKEQQKQKNVYKFINNKQRKAIVQVIHFLKANVKFHKCRGDRIVQTIKQSRMLKAFIRFKENRKKNQFKMKQISSNRSFFLKQKHLKQWMKEFKITSKLNGTCKKILERRATQFLQKLFNTLKQNLFTQKFRRQNQLKILKNYENRIVNHALITWVGNFIKKRQLLMREQNSVIVRQKEYENQQSNDVLTIQQLYESTQQQCQVNEEQLKNYKILVQNSKEVEQELQMQNEYLKQELMDTKEQLVQYQMNEEEISITREQYKLAQQQLKELRLQQKLGSPIKDNDLRKQVEMSSSLLNDQKMELSHLHTEYAKVVGEYERKIADIEKYYVDLCDKQKLQIERLIKENGNLKNENQQNLVSRNKLIDELNMIHSSFKDEHTQDSFEHHKRQRQYIFSQTSEPQYTQNSPDKKKEEAINLREDIKRRLASLKTQMDLQL